MELAQAGWIDLPAFADEAGGVLTAIEATRDVPFPILRAFLMHGTPPLAERGGHAHRDTRQVLIAASGSLRVELSDERATRRFELSSPSRALYMPRMLWVRLLDFSPGSVCLVLADTHYDRSQLIRDWDAFVEARAGGDARPAP